MITELPNTPTRSDPPNTQRLAIIEVSHKVFSQIGISIDAADTQGMLRDEGTFNLIKKALLLPLSYTVLGLFTGPFRRTWLVAVESPELPPVPEYEEAPRLRPTYMRTANGTARLTGMFLQQGEHEVDVLATNRGKGIDYGKH